MAESCGDQGKIQLGGTIAGEVSVAAAAEIAVVAFAVAGADSAALEAVTLHGVADWPF